MTSHNNSSSEIHNRRFVILDRDGTIIEECSYLSHPDQVKLLPGAAKALLKMRELGLGIIIVTNQSGIGRGLFDEHQVKEIHCQMEALLLEEGIMLDGIYFCPHKPDDNCDCRKPKPGLALKAAMEHHMELEKCFVIGDKLSDIEFGKNIGAKAFLVLTGYGRQAAGELNPRSSTIVEDLGAAVREIETILKIEEI